MIEPTTASSDTAAKIADLRSQFRSGSEKTQLQLIPELEDFGDDGLEVLMEFLLERQSMTARWIDGKIYLTLYQANSAKTIAFLQQNFPTGIVPLHSERNIDYLPLQQLLAQQEFLLADHLTIEKLCELAGTSAVQRKWLYFSDVKNFPITDLQTIDALWFVHSEGKFGFSVQRQLWLDLGKKWETLWEKIGWKKENRWTRYPHEFTWDLTAPKGHLPLSNQLRGVRVISSLLSHPAWNQ